jgi:hypothetical protein
VNVNPVASLADRRSWIERLPLWLAIAAACLFIGLAAYRIELPGLYFDEMIFADAAQGNPDTARVHMRVGPVPILIMPYLGALKAWLYIPIFRLFGVSAITVRLPAILLAAATLLILFRAMRLTLGGTWAAIVIWLLALDPANIFPSRLDWGPTVLMHLFQASILALWFSYRHSPQLWKIALISLCCVLGFFDKFNFIWFVAAFAASVAFCYPDSVRRLWVSSPKLIRWFAVICALAGVGVALRLILPIMQFPSLGTLRPHIAQSWSEFQIALSGIGVAEYVLGTATGMIGWLPHRIVIAAAWLALACWVLPMSDANARENRKNGLFCLLIGFFIFVQIVITPQAGGPHHHSMLLPLPLLACAFFARSLYDHFRTIKFSWLAPVAAAAAAAAAICVFIVNFHNTLIYVSHFRSDPHYKPLWSPAIYSLSRYINDHGGESQKIIAVDCCLEQLHPLAPKKVRRRIRDYWPEFKQPPKTREQQDAMLANIFPEGRTLVVTFDASKEAFPETRQNFFALLARHPELKCQLVTEFWYGGEKIYELYEVVRLPQQAITGQ